VRFVRSLEEPKEAYVITIVFVVQPIVDGGDTPDGPTVAPTKEELAFRVFVEWVSVRIQSPSFLANQWQYGVRIVTIDLPANTMESTPVAPRANRTDHKLFVGTHQSLASRV
jgi:hypothetical protein